MAIASNPSACSEMGFPCGSCPRRRTDAQRGTVVHTCGRLKHPSTIFVRPKDRFHNRIDDCEVATRLFGAMHDEGLQRFTHLRGRQANASLRVHRFNQIINQLTEVLRESLNRCSDRPEARVRDHTHASGGHGQIGVYSTVSS